MNRGVAVDCNVSENTCEIEAGDWEWANTHLENTYRIEVDELKRANVD